MIDKIIEMAPQIAEQYARMQIAGSWVGVCIGALFLIIGVICVILDRKADTYDATVSVFGAVIFLIGIVIIAFGGWNIVEWTYWPEARALETLIRK